MWADKQNPILYGLFFLYLQGSGSWTAWPLKMKTAQPFKMSWATKLSTRCHIPQVSSPQQLRCENLRSPVHLITWCSCKWCSVMSVQGWFSPGQVFVLDEYCARYGVRGCYRHLCYLSDLLDRAEKGIMIDPTLIHYSFAFCASHVHGNRWVP